MIRTARRVLLVLSAALFESVPTSTANFGLNYGGMTTKPIRGATVQLLNGGLRTRSPSYVCCTLGPVVGDTIFFTGERLEVAVQRHS